MTKFEQLKARKCTEIRLGINYQKALLDKWENMSIEEMAKEYIRQLDDGKYNFVFRLNPVEQITMCDYDTLVEVIKLWYSQEVSDNE